MKFDDPGSKVQEKDVVTRDEGAARAISAFIDPSLSWKDLAWFKSVTKLPILLKGVQCWEVRTLWFMAESIFPDYACMYSGRRDGG